MLRAGQSRGSIVCVNGVMHYKTVILNQKVLVVKMRPLISRLPSGGGGGCHDDPPPPMDLKSDCIKEIACQMSILCK